MKLTVIGSSSKGNGYVITTNNKSESLIIEAGVKLLEVKKAVDFKISSISGCIVSHQHNDHAGYASEYAKAGVRVLALEEVLKAKGITRNCQRIELGKGYKMGDFKILPFEVMHDVPCVGFVIEHSECGKIVFLTDTYACQYRFANVNHYLIEANYADDILTDNILAGRVPQAMRNRLLTSHFELSNTIAMLKSSDLHCVRNIVLIHLSDGNSDERRFVAECKAELGKKVVAASAGLVLDIDAIPL